MEAGKAVHRLGESRINCLVFRYLIKCCALIESELKRVGMSTFHSCSEDRPFEDTELSPLFTDFVGEYSAMRAPIGPDNKN